MSAMQAPDGSEKGCRLHEYLQPGSLFRHGREGAQGGNDSSAFEMPREVVGDGRGGMVLTGRVVHVESLGINKINWEWAFQFSL